MSTPSPLSAHSSRRIARNAVLNFGGQALQMLAALAVIPWVVRGLGTETFGAFQLVWVALTYFAFFDLGLGRATTRFASEALGRGEVSDLPRIVGSSVLIQVALGLVGGMLMAGLAPVLAQRILNVPAHLVPAVTAAFRLVAFALPAVMLTASCSGVLEAHQRFDLVNAVRVPFGVLTVLAPVVAIRLGAGLVGVVAAVVAVRVIALTIFGAACLAAVPALRAPIAFHRGQLRVMLRYCGWLTVSNVVSPLMVYLDRYVIGATLTLSAVSYYTAPYDAVSRLAVFPAALVATLFPAFSALNAAGAQERLRRLFRRGLLYLVAAMAPVTLALMVFARPGLELWLGAEFAAQGARAAQFLLVGILVNAMAQVPYAVLQGVGRPDLTAKFHLVELPLYAVALWLAVTRFGIVGAAVAWTLRALLDAALLFGAARVLARRARYEVAPAPTVGG